ncbi:MAG: hypothetical protein LAT62_06640 [Natronospirillum sp.]|uniref:hypothetical protein n=1 Tax=Natronospirillum sp. TaxID=2812955 RepID=UPI0025CCAB74|nr:hypothetical protein [Natronospirillum sp.]MCH8551593.1 hypothetical protein [Natronospirillum sp.]
MTGHGLLYCYGGYELLSALKRNELPLTDFADLPSPWLRGETGVGNEIELTEDQWQQALQARYAALPEHIRAAVDFAYFAAQMELKRDQLSAEILQTLVADQQADEALDLARHEGVTVLRLLESPLNPLGWQLLGEGYQGLCIGLQSGQALFQATAGQPRLLRHVRYGPHRTLQATDALPFPGWFEEPEALSAMQEWRLALPRRQARQRDGRSWLPLGTAVVSELYLGPGADDELADAVRDLQRLYQRYRQARRYSVRAAQRSFSLQGRPDNDDNNRSET